MSAAETLQQAYVHTTYWVDAQPGPVAVRIACRNRALERLLAEHEVSHWAFITAWNPYSKVRTSWYNSARHLALLRTLHRARLSWLPAVAQGDAPDWPAESGLLVVGINRAQARRLGRRFRQNAVVIGRLGAAPELLWCRDARDE